MKDILLNRFYLDKEKDNDLKNSQKILTNILNNGNSFTDSFDFFS